MFDVLVYLFESFYHQENRPDQDTLARRLSAAGFEEEDIHEALAWLSELQPLQGNLFDDKGLERKSSFRAHAPEEIAKLSPASRGFIMFLENAHVLTPSLRETVLERAMALDEEFVGLDKLKVIALMVLWTQRGDVDSLILEELLPEGETRRVH